MKSEPLGLFRARDGDPCGAVVAAGAGPCLLCGGSPCVAVGAWAPDAAHRARVMAPPGKVRTIAYGLCGPCTRRPGALRRVEDAILAGFAALAGHPETN